MISEEPAKASNPNYNKGLEALAGRIKTVAGSTRFMLSYS